MPELSDTDADIASAAWASMLQDGKDRLRRSSLEAGKTIGWSTETEKLSLITKITK